MKWFLALVVLGITCIDVEAGPILNWLRSQRAGYESPVTYYQEVATQQSCCCNDGVTTTPLQAAPTPEPIQVAPMNQLNTDRQRQSQFDNEVQRQLQLQHGSQQQIPPVERRTLPERPLSNRPLSEQPFPNEAPALPK